MRHNGGMADTGTDLEVAQQHVLQEARIDLQKRALAQREVALDTVMEIVVGGERDRDRLAAAQYWLKLAGMDPSVKHEHTVKVEDDRAAANKRLDEMMERLERNNPEAAAAIVDAQVVEEGEPEALPPATPTTPTPPPSPTPHPPA